MVGAVGLLALLLFSCTPYPHAFDIPEISKVDVVAGADAIEFSAYIENNIEGVCECGFMYGVEGQEMIKTISLLEGNSFTSRIEEFLYDSRYQAYAYISNGQNVIRSSVFSFVTPEQPSAPPSSDPDLPSDPEPLPEPDPEDPDEVVDWSTASDLSANGTANCYIVSEPGLYKFKPTKGCGESAIDGVFSAEVLWETLGTADAPRVGRLLRRTEYQDGYLCFKVPSPLAEGNAVVAARDDSGAILWSWHIWLTDQPQAQVYPNDAGVMMDRNLGATSATPGEVATIGLFYQWGRKDPFMASYSINRDKIAGSTNTWPSPVKSDSVTGTMEYAVANPMTFIASVNNCDWQMPIDESRWTTFDKGKSIYDPCPAGWRVPEGGKTGIWAKAGFEYASWNDEKFGISLRTDSSTEIWYPAAGERLDATSVSLLFTGGSGFYWSVGSFRYAYHLIFTGLGGVHSASYSTSAAAAISVRCAQD